MGNLFPSGRAVEILSYCFFWYFFPPTKFSPHFSSFVLTYICKENTHEWLPCVCNVENAPQFTANSSSALSCLSVDLMRSGIDILVGTPGRIKDHLQNGKLDLTKVKHVVLDEVDQMLDMGFAEQVEDILRVAYKKGNLNI